MANGQIKGVRNADKGTILQLNSETILALQDQNEWVRSNAAVALGQIGTHDAIKAVKQYQSRQ